MTLQEFSNEFDVLYNNIMSNAAPGLNEYEKSVFLSQAQDELVSALYAGRVLTYGSEAFEETEELKKYLEVLITTATLYPNNNGVLTTGNRCFTLPVDILFTIYEKAKSPTTEYKVLPITHDEYDYILENPFRRGNRVLSLRKRDNEVELIPPTGVTLSEYIIRYLKNPTPIILADISEIGASIKGFSAPLNCALHEAIHLPILKIAVQNAVRAYKT